MPQQHSYSAEAIILKHTDLGEADRILVLFTPHKGKMHVIAKGTRRVVSKKAGHLELLCRSQLQLALGRNLDVITQAQATENFFSLRSYLWYMTCGFYLAELIDRFIEEGAAHPEVYTLFLDTLRALDADAAALPQAREQGSILTAHERSRSQLLLRYFEIYLLSLIGYEPNLRFCAHCNAELRPEENGFTPALGGALCPNCSHLWAQPLSLNALKVLRLLQRTHQWTQVPHFRLDARLHAEIEQAMYGLLRFHLERDLKSWSFLDMFHAPQV